ncbi:hypothetical protein KUTeg_017842 [Tegillarca granosa]|uniref:Eukaryotic translation initiation factor 3 subunit J n=1 Tax=Tegillarca granosa TaxID=220873 RepID=A0ABQ9EHN6_TEGGR|nr:hypothetical protein KUTeg_017842 [Tegillarca granosa]
MSDAEWDADDFEPKDFSSSGAVSSDRWAGEDEDDVKENWEDDEEEKKPDASSAAGDQANKPFVRKKKKLADRIAEKQAAKAGESKSVWEVNEDAKPLTKEDQLADKLKKQRLQEQSDLELAKEAFGVHGGSGIDAMFPETEEQFSEFGEALKRKINLFDKSSHYVVFLDKLFTELVISLELEDIKRLGTSITNIYHEKQRLKKEEAKKKKKNKIVLRAERETDVMGLADAASGGYDDFLDDDFM